MKEKSLRDQLLAAFRKHNLYAPATYFLRNCVSVHFTSSQVRGELEKMERDGLVRKYRPWCRANQLHWQLVEPI